MRADDIFLCRWDFNTWEEACLSSMEKQGKGVLGGVTPGEGGTSLARP